MKRLGTEQACRGEAHCCSRTVLQRLTGLQFSGEMATKGMARECGQERDGRHPIVTRRHRRVFVLLLAVLLIAGGFAWYWRATAVGRRVDALLAEARKQGDGRTEGWLIKGRRADRQPYELTQDMVRLGPTVVPRLIRALRDGHPEVRHLAASALGELGDVCGVEPLIAALQDEDLSVRVAAVSGLGNLGDRRAIEPLIALLKDKDACRTWEFVALALRQLGDRRGAEPLIAALKRDHLEARGQAARALARLGDPRAVEPLIASLRGRDPYNQSFVVRALRNMTGQDLGTDFSRWEDWWERYKARGGNGE